MPSMTRSVGTSRTKAFGDFQTPRSLAGDVARLIHKQGFAPRSVLEPTCGKGSFLAASLETFSCAERFVGIDINHRYIEEARDSIQESIDAQKVDLIHADVFKFDLDSYIGRLPDPLLIIGNPPWVTNAAVSSSSVKNTPTKSNFKRERGINALTGKGNFDVSEWIILSLMERFRSRDVVLAMLCKTSVARKVLHRVWKQNYAVSQAKIYKFDAKQHFNVDVDSCLLVARSGVPTGQPNCDLYKNIGDVRNECIIGYDDGIIVADLDRYRKSRHLRGRDDYYVWRSGLKHDCSKIMELSRYGHAYKNGLGETINIENTLVHRLYKSADVANANRERESKYVIVTQRNIGDDTSTIAKNAPRTWEYLTTHNSDFENRRSRIYKDRPRFSIFGIGPYAFAPWKVAISGFYKKLEFVVIPPENGKPAMVDDTVYYLPCGSERQAKILVEVLNSAKARDFYDSMIFWSDKRPITAELLRRLNLSKLTSELGFNDEIAEHWEINSERKHQLQLTI